MPHPPDEIGVSAGRWFHQRQLLHHRIRDRIFESPDPISCDKFFGARKKISGLNGVGFARAILFSAEFRPDKYIRIPIFFNIATESKQFLVNEQLVNEKASPTLGIGVMIKAFQLKIDDKSKLEFEIGPLASVLFDTKNNMRIAPIIAGRIKILRGENFIMYVGTSYSFGINALGLLYGTGTSF